VQTTYTVRGVINTQRFVGFPTAVGAGSRQRPQDAPGARRAPRAPRVAPGARKAPGEAPGSLGGVWGGSPGGWGPPEGLSRRPARVGAEPGRGGERRPMSEEVGQGVHEPFSGFGELGQICGLSTGPDEGDGPLLDPSRRPGVGPRGAPRQRCSTSMFARRVVGAATAKRSPQVLQRTPTASSVGSRTMRIRLMLGVPPRADIGYRQSRCRPRAGIGDIGPRAVVGRGARRKGCTLRRTSF
jgi:hypothetical protein